MSIGILALLFVFGLLLLGLEILFVPGTTLVGVAGVFFLGIGLYFVYVDFGKFYGHLTLAGLLFLSAILTVISFKSGIWMRFANNSHISGKATNEEELTVNVGDVGTAVSALRPSGKASFNDSFYEVHSQGAWIGQGAKIKVLRKDGVKIIVTTIDPQV